MPSEGRRSDGLRVVVAQRHALLAEALAHLLTAHGLDVVGGHHTLPPLLEAVRRDRPDAVIMDADFDGKAALPAMTAALRASSPATRIVVLADEFEAPLIVAARGREIDGLVLKAGSAAELTAGVAQVVAGRNVFPADTIEMPHASSSAGPLAQLSGRQREVLELLALGLPNGEIAARLFISKNTVKFHVRAIYVRLGVSNRVEAARALARLTGSGSAAA